MQIGEKLARTLCLGEIVARSSRTYPDRRALIEGERTLTYRQYNSLANRYANALREMGVQPGEKVAVWMYNCIEMTALMVGITKIGGVAVPLNFRYSPEEAQYVLADSESVVAIADPEFADALRSIHGQLPAVRACVIKGETGHGFIPLSALEEAGDAEPLVEIRSEDPALLLYTSGTTGRPKGAVLSHLAVVTSATSIPTVTGFRNGDVYLNVVPLFHVGFICFFMAHILLAGTVVVLRAFDPVAAMEAIQRHKVTTVWFVPTMAIAFLNHPKLAEYDCSSIRIWNSAGSALPTRVRNQILEYLPQVRVNDVFGMTETASVTTVLCHEDGVRKTASVGLPIPTVEIRVVDENDQDVPRGEVGEIVYRGPVVMTEYHRNPAATAETLRGGWFHSGDLVRQDEEGFVYLVDRKKDMIISGGENIYPREVEEVLFKHHAVLEAAVIGVPDPHWGESVKALVVLKQGRDATGEELIEFCKEHVASYKKPRSVELVPSLPRNASGKILKHELRRQYGPQVQY